MERTLIILKPDAIQRGLTGKIITRFEEKGLQVVALQGKGAIDIARKMMGATFGFKAEPGTIRGDFGVSSSFNLIHGSDSPESAAAELALWFKPEELQTYELANRGWTYDMSKGDPQ